MPMFLTFPYRSSWRNQITLTTQDCECNREVLPLFLFCGAVIFPLVTA